MPWRKFQDAIRRRDGSAFRTMAGGAREEGHRNLLLLVAEIIDSGLAVETARLNGTARLIARLVYDTSHDPMPAGARTQQCIRRHALYAAGPYSVDLELEHERGSTRVALVGQIADRNSPRSHLREVPVLLMSGKAVVARALSNDFGEFQLEYQMAQRLRLYVPLKERGAGIEVRLMGLT